MLSCLGSDVSEYGCSCTLCIGLYNAFLEGRPSVALTSLDVKTSQYNNLVYKSKFSSSLASEGFNL